jgi:hypothetical protein
MPWNTGIMEFWKVGFLQNKITINLLAFNAIKNQYIIRFSGPIFHTSNIPTFLHPKEPFTVKSGMSSITDDNFEAAYYG